MFKGGKKWYTYTPPLKKFLVTFWFWTRNLCQPFLQILLTQPAHLPIISSRSVSRLRSKACSVTLWNINRPSLSDVCQATDEYRYLVLPVAVSCLLLGWGFAKQNSDKNLWSCQVSFQVLMISCNELFPSGMVDRINKFGLLAKQLESTVYVCKSIIKQSFGV